MTLCRQVELRTLGSRDERLFSIPHSLQGISPLFFLFSISKDWGTLLLAWLASKDGSETWKGLCSCPNWARSTDAFTS